MRRSFLTIVIAAAPAVAAAASDGLVVQNQPGQITVAYQLPPFSISESASALVPGTRTELDVVGMRASVTPGFPALPAKGLLFALPPNAEVRLVIDEVSFYEIEDVWIEPAATSEVDSNGQSHEFLKADDGAYATDAFVPAAPLTIGDRGVAREVDFVKIELTPFLWNPVSRRLRIYDRLAFRIVHGALEESTGEAGPSAGGGGGIRVRGEGGKRVSGQAAEQARAARPFDRMFSNAPVSPSWFVRRPADDHARLASSINPAANSEAYKIEVSASGLLQVTAAELSAAGLMLPISFADLKLELRGDNIRFRRIDGGDGVFELGDAFEFYGVANPDRFTATHVYWLSVAGGGVEMWPVDAFPPGSDSWANVVSSKHRVHVEENVKTFDSSSVHPSVWNPWISDKKLQTPAGLCPAAPNRDTLDVTVSATEVAPAIAGRTYQVRTSVVAQALAGCIRPEQEIELELNGVSAGSEAWSVDDFSPLNHDFGFPIDADTIVEGANTVRLIQPVLPTKLRWVDLDWVELEYERYLATAGGVLEFEGEWRNGAVFYVRGFSSRDVVIVDRRSYGRVDHIVNPRTISLGPGMPVTLSFAVAPSNGLHRIAIYQRSAIGSAQEVFRDTPSNLRDRDLRGKHVTISHAQFLNAAQALTAHRAREMSALLFDVQDVYDEFSWGNIDSLAIKDFLSFAISGAGWIEDEPLFVTLVGDTTDDFRDYRGHQVKLWIPHGEHIMKKTGPGRLVASDAYYQLLVGRDDVTDLLLGRLAFETEAEVSTFIDKLIAYETRPWGDAWNRRALMVLDDDIYDQGSCEAIMNPVERFLQNLACCYLGTTQPGDLAFILEDEYDRQAGTQVIIDERNEGVAMTLYLGHGSVTKLGKKCDTGLMQDIFGNANLADLTNSEALPLSVSLSCNVGKVEWVEINNGGHRCMGERFTVSATGDLAFIAGTTSTTFADTFGHAEGLLDALYNPTTTFLPPFAVPDSRERAGSLLFASYLGIVLNARIGVLGADVMRTMLLFGDPATRLKIAIPPAPDFDLCAEPLDCPNNPDR